MKTYFKILPIIIIAVLLSVISKAQDNSWEVGIKLNSFRTNIPDLYKAAQGGTHISWDEELIYNPYYRDNSISWGFLLKKKMKSCSINVRADFFKLDKKSVYGPFENITDTSFFTNRINLKQTVFTLSPQIEFANDFNKTSLVYGFELPMTFYGNAKFSHTNELEKNGQLLSADYFTGELGFGTTIGIGMFGGFYYRITENLSAGGVLFSSIDYYSNSEKSFTDAENISQFSPLVQTIHHEDEDLDFKAIVFSPVNLSFIISYKIK
jgi:hypothetical protein